MTIESQYKLGEVLSQAHASAAKLKTFQAAELHKELTNLSEKYGDSAYASRLQAVTTLAVTLTMVVGCNMLAYGVCNTPDRKTAQDFLVAIGKTGSEIGQAATKIYADPKKVRADGDATILNTKISNQQGQGATSAKTAEDAVQQAAAAAARAFQESVRGIG